MRAETSSKARARRFATLAIAIVALIPISAQADRPRGGADTPEREVWCRGQTAICKSDGVVACDRKFPKDPTAAAVCYDGVEGACEKSFGRNGYCRSIERAGAIPKKERPIKVKPNG